MDSLTQAVFGSLAAQCGASREQMRRATVCGALGGMAPDLDVLIKSANDPLLSLEYHRHFTHSLVFIPFGAAIIAFLIWLVFYRKEGFKYIYLFTLLGFATHGLLDTCTTYGTRLYWPFDQTRISWNIISIIDPLYTLPLLVLTLFARAKRQHGFTAAALVYLFAYLGFGSYQHLRAQEAALEIAASRGHTAEIVFASPSFANLLLWRTIYIYNGRYYVNAVRLMPPEPPLIYVGNSTPVVNVTTLYPEIPKNAVLHQDLARYHDFTNGYIFLQSKRDHVYGDLRYGILPNSVMSRWSMELDPTQPNKHARRRSSRDQSDSQQAAFRAMLLGEAEGVSLACLHDRAVC